MMKTYTIPGFPGHSSDYIESPNIMELLYMPIFSRCDEDRFRKLASDWQKNLLDQCPLLPGYKYLVIDSYTQFMYPDMCPVGTRSGVGELYEWHCDGFSDLEKEPSAFHLFQTDSKCASVFNEEPIQVELPYAMGIGDFNAAATKYAVTKWGVKGKQMENNKYLTFTNHLHRSTPAQEKQLRFFFRVTQSNTIDPALDRPQPRTEFRSFHIGENGKSEQIDNITRDGDSITIHFKS